MTNEATGSTPPAEASPPGPVTIGARVSESAAFALLFAAGGLAVRTLLAPPSTGISGTFVAGALVTVPLDVAIGLLLALPIYRAPRSWPAKGVSFALATAIFFARLVLSPKLPGAIPEDVWSVAGLPPLGGAVMLSAFGTALTGALGARLRPRWSRRAARVADGVALAMLALLGVGAGLAGSGELYAGAVPPLGHALWSPEGREAVGPDPVAERRHSHGEHGEAGEHGEHGHEHHEHDPTRRYAETDRVVQNR